MPCAIAVPARPACRRGRPRRCTSRAPRRPRSRPMLADRLARAHADLGRAQRAREARHAARVLAGVEHRRPPAAAARRAAGRRRARPCGAIRTRGRPPRVGAVPVRRRASSRRGAVAVEEVVGRGAPRRVRARGGPASALSARRAAPGAAARTGRAPAAWRSGGALDACSSVLPLPALVGGARRAQLADDARLAGGDEDVSGCSPRSRRRSQTSQATSGWDVTIDAAWLISSAA